MEAVKMDKVEWMYMHPGQWSRDYSKELADIRSFWQTEELLYQWIRRYIRGLWGYRT